MWVLHCSRFIFLCFKKTSHIREDVRISNHSLVYIHGRGRGSRGRELYILESLKEGQLVRAICAGPAHQQKCFFVFFFAFLSGREC